MDKKSLEKLVGSWVEEIIAGSDRELVDVEFVKEGPDWILRVFLDKPGGIDLEDCRTVNLALSDRLDEEDPIPHAYTLEVSSPGLERPLKKTEDFQRFTGRLVNIKTYHPIDGKKEFEGYLLGITDGMVELDIQDSKVAIPYDSIAKARLAVEF